MRRLGRLPLQLLEGRQEGEGGELWYRLKASDSGSSNQQHSMLMALLTGPMQM